MAGRIRIDLFGTMRVRLDEEPLPRLRSRKAKWLLALLALRGGEPVGRGHVAGMLWPDTDAKTALTNLRSVVSDLRRALGPQSERLRTPDRGTLAFDLREAEVDALAFDAAIRSGEPEGAVAIYSGPLLGDCDEEWAVPERNARERACLDAFHRMTEAADPERAVELARRASEIAPWQDGPRRDLMNALFRAGDLNAALAVYRNFAQALRGETGRTPDLQTTDLYVRLRSGTLPTPAAEAPAGSSFPHPITSFVGREDETLEVAEALRRHRLVTLVGLGGMGKTRLAREVALAVADTFADGSWFVPLDATRDEAGLVRQVALALRIRESADRPLLDAIVAHLRSKRLLLVLDNCEQILPACARLAERLLAECRDLHLLATSRETLGLIGEQVWPVPGLTVPDPLHLPEQPATRRRVMMGYESVRLFVERAQEANGTFELTWDDSRAVAELCGLLDGSPLALELAACRTRTLSVRDIVERLREHRLDLLSAKRRTAMPRHQSLRAALDWSYSLLDGEERGLFARLSVFSGGWTLRAAERVAGATADRLDSLVQKSLVQFSSAGRYRLLETVREYACERLDDGGERVATEIRHLEFFAELAEGLEDSTEAMREFEREGENFRAGLDRGGRAPETALRLAAALGPCWDTVVTLQEGANRLEAALAGADPGPTEARAKALHYLGHMHFSTDRAAAVRSYEASLSVWRGLGDQAGIARSLHSLGVAAFFAGDLADAKDRLAESLNFAREAGDPRLVAYALGAMAQLSLQEGDYRSAEMVAEESLAIFRAIGKPQEIGWGIRTLGLLAHDRGDYAKMRACNEEARTLFEKDGASEGVAWCLKDLGTAASELGQLALGFDLLDQAYRIFWELGSPIGKPSILESLGQNALARGAFADARRWLSEASSLFRALDHRLGVARVLDGEGDLLRAEGRPEADARFREALVIWGEVGNGKRIRDDLLRLGDGMADLPLSVRIWAAAHRMGETMGVPVPLPLRERHERAMEEARPWAGFAEAWAEGREMSLDAALRLALKA